MSKVQRLMYPYEKLINDSNHNHRKLIATSSPTWPHHREMKPESRLSGHRFIILCWNHRCMPKAKLQSETTVDPLNNDGNFKVGVRKILIAIRIDCKRVFLPQKFFWCFRDLMQKRDGTWLHNETHRILFDSFHVELEYFRSIPTLIGSFQCLQDFGLNVFCLLSFLY